jgi:hypothetical protein
MRFSCPRCLAVIEVATDTDAILCADCGLALRVPRPLPGEAPAAEVSDAPTAIAQQRRSGGVSPPSTLD